MKKHTKALWIPAFAGMTLEAFIAIISYLELMLSNAISIARFLKNHYAQSLENEFRRLGARRN